VAGEYKSACGCKIHVAQWTAKRKIVTQESCPMHKSAPDMFGRLNTIVNIIETVDRRCEAADGPVPSTREEMTDVEMRQIYKLARGTAKP
jgi:hypothetical protein